MGSFLNDWKRRLRKESQRPSKVALKGHVYAERPWRAARCPSEALAFEALTLEAAPPMKPKPLVMAAPPSVKPVDMAAPPSVKPVVRALAASLAASSEALAAASDASLASLAAASAVAAASASSARALVACQGHQNTHTPQVGSVSATREGSSAGLKRRG